MCDAGKAHADSIEEALSVCDKTALFREKAYPEETPQNIRNNLRRETGSGFTAAGKPIVIRGYILDNFCLPVANARVELWHADADGNYPWADKNYEGYFQGFGVHYTNNLGEFSFLTVKPGSKNKKKPPFVSFKVTEAKLGSMSTRMYFPEEPSNRYDEGLKNAVNKGFHPFAIKKTLELSNEDEYIFNIRYPVSERWSSTAEKPAPKKSPSSN